MTEAGAASHPPNKDYETSYQQFSTFREETSHGVGDPYFTADAAVRTSRTSGKQISTRPAVAGQLPEAYFDKKIRSLADGDQYQDPAHIEKEIQQKLGGQPASDKSFFPPKSSRKSACPGDPSACMGDVGLFGSDWKDKDPTEDAASVKGKRNLYVNPPRRGGCGYSLAERTIGGKAPQYMPDPYQNGRQLGKELRRKARERIAKPFNAAPNAGSGLFNPNPHTAPPGPLYRSSAERGLKAGVPEGKQPFRQPGPPGKGAAYCTLSKVGQDYVMQPPEEKPEKQEDGQKEKPFKPCAGIKDRLSMWSVNPYQYEARPPPDLDFTLFD